MKKTNQSRMADNYTSMSWGRGDKLYASDLTKMSRQVDSNENELVDLTTTTIPKIVSDVASNKSTLDEFAPKVAKIDVPEGSTIVKEIDKAVADLVNGAPETLDTIKEVADAIEQNGDAIDALNDIVTKNKVAIDSVDAEQKATAEKLATLDSKAVKYQEFGENRKTIQLANYDTISGVTTKGLGVNLAMVSKCDKADFGSAQIETNLNAKDGIVTINDTETVATVKQVGEAAGQLNTKFETFKTETYEPKVAELTKSIGDETSARQDAITETKNAFKAADEKVTGEYTKAIEAAKTEVTTKVTEVEGALNAYKGSNDAAVAKVKTDVTEAFGAADQALETKVTQGYTAAVEGEKAAREAAVALLATKVELEGVNATLTGKFGDYYTKGEVDGKLASIYRFKDSVAAEDQLPTQDQVIGDVYNVEDTGMNVAWDGKKWDKLGSVINLTPYATTEAVEAKITETKQAASEALNQHAQTAETTYAKKAEVAKQIEAVDGKFAGKADKVHTHTIENITGLQDALDGKQAVGDYALKSEVKTVDDKFAGYTTTEALNGLLDSKAAVVHTHTVDNVTGLQAALDAKMAASEAAKFAQASHVHAIENVTGLQQALNDKIAVADADGKYALKSAITGLATKEELNGKAAASHTHQEGEVEGLTAKLATFALKSEIAGFVTDEALKRDYTNYVAKTEVNSIVEAAVKAPVFVNIPLRPEPNYTEAAIANWFGCETIEQVGQVITGDKVVYLHFTSTGKDYKIPVQYCAFKADGSNDIILMTVGLDTANDEVCKYKITIALNSDSSTVDVNKTPLVSPAA